VAEILIQRKRRRRKWPWVLGPLALASLFVPFFWDRDEVGTSRGEIARRDTLAPRDTTQRVTATAAGAVAPGASTPPAAADTSAARNRPPAAPTDTGPATTPPPVGSAFDRFIASSDPSSDERANRRYTAGALRRLAVELRTLGASAPGVTALRAQAESLEVSARRRQRDADYARTAFLAAVRELDLLRDRRAVIVDTARLRSTAWAVVPNRPLAAQRPAVQAFFEAARDALHALSGRR
jgi:hypothetical protein